MTSLSCKLLNTKSCQGLLPTTSACLQTPWNQARSARHGHHHQPSLSLPVPAERSAWSTQKTRCLTSSLEASCLQGTCRRAPHPQQYHPPAQG